jgi:hypothetical protein
MSRVQSTVQLPIEVIESAKERLIGALQFAQCEITSVGDFNIDAKRGSQVVFRGKGAMIANDVDYPIKIAIGFFQNEGKFLVNIAVDEDMGFGLMIGAKGKYQGVCDRLRDTLAVSLN